LWGTIVAVVIAVPIVGYFGYGRWWGKARAKDIHEAILRELYAKPAYIQFQKEIVQIYIARPAMDIWLSVPELPVKRTDWDKLASPPEDTALLDRLFRLEAGSSYQETVSRLDHAVGRIPDGRYRVSLVMRTALSTALLEKPVTLAEYIGEAELAIHNGKLLTISVTLLDLRRISSLHHDMVSVLRSTQREKVDATYHGTRLQLLDASACSFRNAAHLKHLVEDSADSAAQRLLHAIFLLPDWRSADLLNGRSARNYHRDDHFTLASAGRLRIPKALTHGDGESCRICVLATRMNHFGEPVDASQAIVALEQTSNQATTVREVARVEAIEFDARFVNGLLAVGDPPFSEDVAALLLVAFFTIVALLFLLALVIVRQLQLLFIGWNRTVTIKNKIAVELPSKVEELQK
jgi:hypothetical protein